MVITNSWTTTAMSGEKVHNPRRKMMRIASIEKDMVCSTKFEVSRDEPLPELPSKCVRLRVCYAGACSPDTKRDRNSIRNDGLMDTSLFPGYEISGIVDEVGPDAQTTLTSGDRVLLYQEEDIGFDEGYTEYVTIKDIDNILPIPDDMSLEVAALLPCGGLTAYTACLRAKPYIEECEKLKGKCNLLIVGAGGLGLWATIMASHLSGPPGTCDNRIKVLVADTNSEKLKVAREHGCYGVVHWPSNAYEQQIQEITENACPQGIDVVIDFVSSPRTICRAMKFLNKRGVMVVGGNSQHSVSFNLSDLAKNEQTIIGVRKGTRSELLDLVNMVSSGMVSTPHYDTFQLTQANTVFQELSDCKLNGRAVLKVSPTFI
ncbi:alcohol dehydrogenase-like [Watersipora subatra]|uniref:alcohol dehydrogenase-like n=1 Tax=Watersipora subatra TaxID=2589382 RepID=UPI00355C5FB6